MCEWVLGRIARRLRPVHRDGDRRRDRRDVCAQPLEHRVWLASRIRRPGRPPNGLDRRTGGNSSVATARWRNRRPCWEQALCPSESAPVWIRAARCRRPSTSSRAIPRKSSSSLARLRTQRMRRRCSSAIDPRTSRRSFEACVAHWDEVLGTVQVKTPDRSMDIILNRWMLYQTLACRMWARSAFYQASGAYGFRDQLQDGMALAVSRPGSDARASAARRRSAIQRRATFSTGGCRRPAKGVRTRISDDRIWLAYAVVHYVETTGDAAVLDESVPFIEGQALQPGEHEAYFQPSISDDVGVALRTLCARARCRVSPSANTACL